MSDLRIESLGPLQRAVMEVLWEDDEATVHNILVRLAESKTLAYTSVLSCLQKLEKLGWVDHRAEERTYYYRPVKSRNEVGGRSLLHLLNGVFGGNASQLFQQLLESDQLTAADLAELQRLIDQRRAEKG
ncbi:MAG TPA: BlaI/MecI/CopY family transcriptional regulator [Gemmataceae bacterium]|nr:BlaI/MecI/CopY family transcriptional regulator [Gemmataceae bacterium]